MSDVLKYQELKLAFYKQKKSYYCFLMLTFIFSKIVYIRQGQEIVWKLALAFKALYTNG